MLHPTQSADGNLSLVARLRNSRQSGRFGVNRVKDGHTINTLRATGGPPAGKQFSSAGSGSFAAISDRGSGRRSTSLFDLPRSGSSVLSKLQGQPKSSNPLLSGLTGDSFVSARATSLTSRQRSSRSLAAAQSQAAVLRQRATSIDSRSRFLQAQTSLLRSTGGFGAILSSSFNLLA